RIFKTNDPSNTGLHTIIPLDSQIQEINISIPLSLKGSRGLLFTPTAKKLSLKYSSTFTDPSFIGEYLPDRNLTDTGFTAEWNILEYNKEVPNFFNETRLIKVGNSIFGMNIQNPVNHYSKTDRACKYLILFILVIFLSLFLTEIYYRIKVHLFQYGLIGFALAIFFALLLSISEFINFNSAYAISFISVTILIFLFSKSIFSNKSSVYLLSSLVITFFSFIFIIIQLEKTALLFGTIMLFSILAATMYVTTNIKWNEEKNETQNNNELTEEKILY
ncbi:MAG: hypothetical protein HOP11_11145, partial [Saprospiraceae bacterium]|nr:hypothetical protein [Saprospiraceae bacterium]